MSEKVKVLDVYFKDDLAGQLIRADQRRLSFKYSQGFLDHASMGISLSLPLQEEAFDDTKCKSFFSGLLPEENIREKLARYFGISKKNSFDFLKEIGRECAGALTFYPEGEISSTEEEELEFLDSKKLQEILKLLNKSPILPGEDKMRLSLAGAQNKLPVRLIESHGERQIFLAKGGAPTTHILKPMIQDVEDSVQNEAFCMGLAKLMGINVPNVWLMEAEETFYYLIERYDRKKNEQGKWIRLHQEDFCQALSIIPENKYQKEGGPSINQCQELILNYSSQPASELLQFMQLIIFNYLIGNSDAHGKNFSFLYQNGQILLSPAYDLMSTAIYETYSSEMAMRIGSRYDPNVVLLRHWYTLVPETKASQDSLKLLLQSFSESIVAKSIKLKKEFQKQPGGDSPIIKRICDIIKQRSEKVLSELV